MKKDEAIAQIRQVRHRILEEHGHDPQKLVNYYIELQKQYPSLKLLSDEPIETVEPGKEQSNGTRSELL